MALIAIALEGIVLAVVVNTPLIFYVVWSWRLLKRHANDVAGDRIWLRRMEVCLRLLLTSTIVSVVWPVVSRAYLQTHLWKDE